MQIIDEQIQSYCDAHTSPESSVLKQLNRDTFANVLQPRMLSGHFQGRLLSMMSKMMAHDSTQKGDAISTTFLNILVVAVIILVVLGIAKIAKDFIKK